MSGGPDDRNFADTGLDWAVADDFTPEERERLLAWYRDTHGTGNTDLVQFAPFLIENLPGAFKLSRRHLITVPKKRDGVGMPDLCTILFYLHTYTAMAHAKGILYELINARAAGATRELALEVLAYAYLSAGPRGISAAAELSTDYMREWPADEPGKPIAWPEGWKPDPAVFRSGIDLGTAELKPGEADMIAAWHEKMYGVVPRHVKLFAELHPEAFKVQRIRYEKAFGTVMPAPLAPLMTLHWATHRLQPSLMRQAAHQAKVLGARRHHVVQALLFGLRQSIDPMVMEIAAEAVGDLLESWKE